MTHVEDTTGADTMPSSLTELEPIVREFVTKLRNIQQEQQLLKDDEKALIEDYSTKLDMKVMKSAMRVMAIKDKVSQKDTFDTLLAVLETI